MSMPAVGLFVGSSLTLSFGLACRSYTFGRNAFNVLFQKIWGLTSGFTFRAYQRCTESEIFDSDSAPASAEYTPTPLRHILKFWTTTPAQTPKLII